MQDTHSTTHKAKRGRLHPATTSSSYFTVRTIPTLNNKSSREGESTPRKFKRGLMSADTLPTFLLFLLLLFDRQILRNLQIQVQERGSIPRKFKRRARYLKISYPTKQAKQNSVMYMQLQEYSYSTSPMYTLQRITGIMTPNFLERICAHQTLAGT